MESECPIAPTGHGVNTPDEIGALNLVLILSIVLMREGSDVYHLNI